MGGLVLALTWMVQAASAGPVSTTDVVEVFSPRHAVDCAAVFDLGDDADVTRALVDVADTIEFPPWVGTRSAACAVSVAAVHPVAAEAAARWVSAPDQLGLTLTVLDYLDRWPESMAESIARSARQAAAADIRRQELVVPRLQRSMHPSVRALVE